MSAGAIYFGSAALVALLGLVLLAWALFADRSRGRKRCPKCWYDMSAAVSLLCPECGREARHERKLRKTRRRWKVALAALLLFGFAGFLAIQPKVQQDGWWSVMPTTLMLLYFQFEQDDAVIEAIERRMTAEEWHPHFAAPMEVHDPKAMYRWQWKWLANLVIDRLNDDSISGFRRQRYFGWVSTMREILVHEAEYPSRLTSSVVRFLEHKDPNARMQAAIYGVDRADPEGTIARLVPLLDDDDVMARRGAVTGMRVLLLYTGSEVAIDALINLLEHEDTELQASAAAALGSFGRSVETPHPEMKQALRKAFDRTEGESGQHRFWFVSALADFSEPHERLFLVREMLLSTEPDVRAGAFAVVANYGLPAGDFLEDVIRELTRDDSSSESRNHAAWILQRLRQPELLRRYQETLRILARHEEQQTREAAHQALGMIGIEVEEFEPEKESS